MNTKRFFAATSIAATVISTEEASAAPELVEQTGLEREVAKQVQTLRRSKGLPSVRYSTALSAGAQARARDMARRGYFAHTDASGTPFWIGVMRYYPSRGWRSWKIGENLLWTAPQLDASTVVRRWLDSPAHRAILLKAGWRDVGAAAVRVRSAPGVYSGQDVTIVTLELGYRR